MYKVIIFPKVSHILDQSDGLNFFNKLGDFFSVLFPIVVIEIRVIFLVFIEFDNIILIDFDVDDFPLTEKGVDNGEVPLVLSGFDSVVLVELEFELLLWGLEDF
jgi:hypothetical protein